MKEIPFYEYLISLGAKKNWFEANSNMRLELYYKRKIYDGSMIDEIGIKSQSMMSKLFYNANNFLPIRKIFPKNSKNLYNINFYAYEGGDFPFKQVLKSKGSFEEISKNYLLALNEIEKIDILNESPEEDDEADYWDPYYTGGYERYHEDDEDEEHGVFENHNILIDHLYYPESYEVDPVTGHGPGNLSLFDLEPKQMHFLEKPYMGNHFILWGNDDDIKYFLPLRFIVDTKWVSVIVKDKL